MSIPAHRRCTTSTLTTSPVKARKPLPACASRGGEQVTGLSYTCSKQQSTVPAKRRATVLPPPPRSQTGSRHQKKIRVDRDTHPPIVFSRTPLDGDISTRFPTPRRTRSALRRSQGFLSLTMNKRWVGALGRRCSGERGVHQSASNR